MLKYLDTFCSQLPLFRHLFTRLWQKKEKQANRLAFLFSMMFAFGK
jgi:hypothetical protein